MAQELTVHIKPRLSDDIRITPLMMSEGASIVRRLINQGDLTDDEIAIGVYRVMFVMSARETVDG